MPVAIGSRRFGRSRYAAPSCPAISNAIFDATGVRLRSLPFTPAKLKAAAQGT